MNSNKSKLLTIIIYLILFTALSFNAFAEDEAEGAAQQGDKSAGVESAETAGDAAPDQDAAAAGEEEESPLSFTLNSGIMSSYVTRGQYLFKGNSIQTSFNANYATEDYGDFWIDVWSHYPGASKSGQSELSPDFIEIDYTQGWTYNEDDWTFTLGHSFYSLPRKHVPELDYTLLYEYGEVFTSIMYEGIITPTFTFYQDYSYFYTQYYNMNLSHTINLESAKTQTPVDLTFFVDFGFASNSEVKLYEKNGLVCVSYGVSADVNLGDFVLSPTINYTQKVDEYTINKLWMGFNLSYSF